MIKKRRTRLEVHQQIQVAIRASLSPGDGAEHGDPMSPALPRDAEDLWAAAAQPIQCQHVIRHPLRVSLDDPPAPDRPLFRRFCRSMHIHLGNPIRTLKWTAPRISSEVDRRCVVNPRQARALLAAVRPAASCSCGARRSMHAPTGPTTEAAVSRGSSSTGLTVTAASCRYTRSTRSCYSIISRSAPRPAAACSAAFAAANCRRSPTGAPGSKLARRLSRQPSKPLPGPAPYDLRHACLSTWLNGGGYPTQDAEWAGHSVDVLLRIYARRCTRS